MTSFEHVLSNHRTLLANYMTEWSQHQEFLISRYAEGGRGFRDSHALKRGCLLDDDDGHPKTLWNELTDIPFETTGCLKSALCARSGPGAKMTQENGAFEIAPYPHAERGAAESCSIEHPEIIPYADFDQRDFVRSDLCFAARPQHGEALEDSASMKQSCDYSHTTDANGGSVAAFPAADSKQTTVDPYATSNDQGSVKLLRPPKGAGASAKQSFNGWHSTEPSAGFESSGSRPGSPPSSPRGSPFDTAKDWSSTNANVVFDSSGSPRDANSPRQSDVPKANKRSWGSHATSISNVALPMEGIKAQLSFKDWSPPMMKKGIHHGFIAKVVESSVFSVTFGVVIVANAAFMAVAADQSIKAVLTGAAPNDAFFEWADAMFTVCYVIELSLKLAAYGTNFFVGPEWKSNAFDFVIIVSAVLDLIAPFFMDGSVNISYLRINRMVKLIKMVRVVKAYLMFKELRLIVSSLMGCAKIMFWAISLVGFVAFMFALFFVQGVTEHLLAREHSEMNEVFVMYWGSITTAMISLFQSPTGGEDWAEVAEPLWELGWGYYVAFMIYICFFMFFVVNVLTGLFVDAALHASIKDDAQMIQQEMKNKEEYVRRLQTLFHRLDERGSGELKWKDFETKMNSPEMLTFASTLDIEIADVSEFFRIISAGGREIVDIETFVVGCMKLKGSAKSLDVVSLLYRHKVLEHQLKRFVERTDEGLAEQRNLVYRICQRQEGRSLGCSGISLKRSPTV